MGEGKGSKTRDSTQKEDEERKRS